MEEIPEPTMDQDNGDALQKWGTWVSIAGVGIIFVGDVLIGSNTFNIWEIEPFIYNVVAGIGVAAVSAGMALTCSGLNRTSNH